MFYQFDVDGEITESIDITAAEYSRIVDALLVNNVPFTVNSRSADTDEWALHYTHEV